MYSPENYKVFKAIKKWAKWQGLDPRLQGPIPDLPWLEMRRLVRSTIPSSAAVESSLGWDDGELVTEPADAYRMFVELIEGFFLAEESVPELLSFLELHFGKVARQWVDTERAILTAIYGDGPLPPALTW